MTKLKVVHIVEALGGGIYSYFINLTQVLAPHPNIDLTVIYSDNRQEINANKIAKDFHPDTTLIKVAMLREISPVADYNSFKDLRSELKKLKPDVLHLHSSKAGILGRLAFLAAFKFNTRLYYTPHGYSFLRKDISGLKRFAFFTIEFLSQKLTGGKIVACGDTELKYSKKIGPSILVRNGISFKNTLQHETLKSDRIQNIVTLGRITYARNPSLFNTIALQNPDLNFIWIGDGELKHLITAPNIQVTGWFEDRNVALSTLSKADVYLQTSLWEGLPIALLEAAAQKIPIVATAIIGNRDIIVNGKTGILIEEASDFKAALNTIEAPHKRKKMGMANYERCSLLFDSSRNFNKLISIYSSEYQ